MGQPEPDPLNNIPCLTETWAPRDSLRQRRGRAGRVRPGVCYRTLYDATFQALPPSPGPALLWVPTPPPPHQCWWPSSCSAPPSSYVPPPASSQFCCSCELCKTTPASCL